MTDHPIVAETPDVETSSREYASRFGGRAGRYLLEIQERAVAKALDGMRPGTVLDVGGGHGQLVDPLVRLGWSVVVHGTAAECERNLRELHGKRNCGFIQGPLYELPAADQSFDLVIAVRLISHVPAWRRLIAELCRVARQAVVIDYSSKSGINALTPLLFGMKKSLEGNTRTYTNYSRTELCNEFVRNEFSCGRHIKQFFLPMVAHRAGKGAKPLRWAENAFRITGLTALAGSPVVLRADRSK